MKKIVLICLVILMTLSLTSVVFAADAFISSPFKTGAPELVSAKNRSEGCVAVLSITAYADRASLSGKVLEKFEYVYGVLRGETEDLDFSALLAQIAEEKGIDVNDLAISDFFDISCGDCQGHDDHKEFDIVLKAEALDKFVCLVHYYNGSWLIVDDAEVTHEGTHLEFTEEEFSPFVIVVNTGDASLTDDNSRFPWWWIIIILLVIATSIYVSIKWKKIKKVFNK